MCVHCVGRNSCHKLKCEKGLLIRCILCTNACKNFDYHMSCDVVELGEKSCLNVTTKMHLKCTKCSSNCHPIKHIKCGEIGLENVIKFPYWFGSAM